MANPAKEMESRIYSIFSDVASCIGYSPIHGKIIGALLVNGEMTLEQIAKKTGYSIGMISLSLDLLDTLGVVRKNRKSGDRKLYATLSGDLLGCLKKVFVARLEKGIENSLKEMENGKKQLKNVRATEKEKISKTIDILEKEIRKLGKYVKLFSDI